MKNEKWKLRNAIYDLMDYEMHLVNLWDDESNFCMFCKYKKQIATSLGRGICKDKCFKYKTLRSNWILLKERKPIKLHVLREDNTIFYEGFSIRGFENEGYSHFFQDELEYE